MPTMPNCAGLDFYEAQARLQQFGVYDPQALGYFGTFPISAEWIPGATPAMVVAQYPPYGYQVGVNSPVIFRMTQFPIGVSGLQSGSIPLGSLSLRFLSTDAGVPISTKSRLLITVS